MIDISISKNQFNDVYYPYLTDYSHRYEVWYGGAGSGKSVFVCQKLIFKACCSVRKILVIRKYGTTIEDSVFDLFIGMLKKWKLHRLCKINLSNHSIKLPNGSQIIFKGLDDSEKIKSITDISDIFIEECTEINDDEFTQLDLRLRAMKNDLQIFCAFNPVSKVNWVYKKWFKYPEKVNKNTLIMHTTYKQNKFLPDEYVKALEEQQETNPNYFKIYALGEFCSLDKLVFNNWRQENFDYKDIEGELIVGMDFGFSADLSTVVASICDEINKKIYVFKTWGSTGYTNDKLAEVIKELGFTKSKIMADCSEPKSIKEIKNLGVVNIKECKKGHDSIIHGIQKLQQFEIIVNPSCTGLIIELENYSWKKDKKSNEYINTPIDSFNHYIDALRYSIQIVDKQKVKVLNKSVLGL